MTSDHRLSEAYEDMTEIARLKRRIAELEAELEKTRVMTSIDEQGEFVVRALQVQEDDDDLYSIFTGELDPPPHDMGE